MTMTHIRLRTVVVGDVLSDGSEVTMIGPSVRRPGSAFLAVSPRRAPPGPHAAVRRDRRRPRCLALPFAGLKFGPAFGSAIPVLRT